MSHLTTAQQGLEAIKTKQWDLAITKLTTALDSTPSPIWLLARSKAFIGKGLATEALTDAERAWHVAYDRGSRSLMLEAQYRRAVACYHLGRLADADCCCVYAMRLAKGFAAVEEKDPGLEFVDEGGRWIATAEQAMEESRGDSSLDVGRDVGRLMGGVGKDQGLGDRLGFCACRF
ncbi:SGT1 and CS domain containing protein [Ophiocordyceps camponoti-floridani]|uniref:SGT1 and CS domain containing protein n=1 Tax=Ophiocordyceps camponoti-floridani TaxID=2030778 RepID=A0A8H4Q5F7_9HYPO|nr:SGT1 and CS domain containing protein [Ophiocordyceps camponoti-floridani]